MPTYDKRLQELTERLTSLHASMPDHERQCIQDVLNRYYARRNDALSNLAYVLGELSMDPKASLYNGMLSVAAKDCTDCLHGMLDAIREPSLAALTLRGQVLEEEASFWQSLQTLFLGELRDLLLKQEQKLIDYTRVLQDKWSKLTDEEKYIEQLEQESTRAIQQSFRETLEQGLPVHLRTLKLTEDLVSGFKQMKRDIAAYIAEQLVKAGAEKDVAAAVGFFSTYGIFKQAQAPIVEMLGGPAGKELVSTLSDGYDGPLRFWIQGTLAERIHGLRQRMNNRNSMLATFSTTRHEADAFLRDNSFASAKAMWQNAESDLKGWPSRISSSGLKADAEAWADQVLEGFSQRLDKLEDTFNSFIAAHERRFIGAVGPELEEAFLQTRAWEDWEATLFSHGVEAKLRTWRSSLPEVRLTLETAFEDLSGAFGDLPGALRERFQQELNGIRREYMAKLEQVQERSRRTLEQAESAASESSLRARLDRSALRSTLMR